MENVSEALQIGRAQWLIILEVIVAMVLGGLIGIEREGAAKPAGLRTHMLVAGAAALFVGLAGLIVRQFPAQEGMVRSDPIRVFEAVITGISFLGAGTIIFHRGTERVEGITTAASLLFTAAIGVTVGMSQWFLSVVLTGVVLFVLRLVGKVRSKKAEPPKPSGEAKKKA